MTFNQYINQDGKRLRLGYTTGSCATGAAKAACMSLIDQEKIETVTIPTPAGIELNLPVENVEIHKDWAQASIKKDGGDDIDATHGLDIFARVSFSDDKEINITGGQGVGKITKKGLYGDIGDYAINPVPKDMIKKEISRLTDRGVDVEIFVPQGAQVAKKTFNENIGIQGGISIIGTKGIVYPMSIEAYLKTIYMEIDAIQANHGTNITLSLTIGNYGTDWARDNLEDPFIVQVSNYLGKGLKYAYNKGFRDFYLIGHIGKLSKVSIGIFNTHNETADTRMEAIVYYMAKRSIDQKHLGEVDQLMTAEEAATYLKKNDLAFIVKDMEEGINKRVKKYLKDDSVKVRSKIYSLKEGGDFD